MTALPPVPDGGAAPGIGPLALGSMCTGYAGLDMAVSAVLDVRPAWVADPDPGAAAILAHRMPGVPNLGDITRVDWTAVPPVDVVCGGYPCQPFSVAGKKKGTADERHLWPYIATALRVLRPRLAIFENVANHLRLGFADVLADLADLGFDAEWCLVRADEVGAPHQRRRLFLLAWPADADRPRLEGHRVRGAAPERRGAAPDAACDGRHEGRPEPTRLIGRPDAALGGLATAAHPARVGHGDARTAGFGGIPAPALAGASAWGPYGPAIERWARVLGRPAPRPTEPGRTGERLSPRFVEWLMGVPAGHVTAVPGLTRNAQLKALGNGVVPAQGAAALDILLDRMEAAA